MVPRSSRGSPWTRRDAAAPQGPRPVLELGVDVARHEHDLGDHQAELLPGAARGIGESAWAFGLPEPIGSSIFIKIWFPVNWNRSVPCQNQDRVNSGSVSVSNRINRTSLYCNQNPRIAKKSRGAGGSTVAGREPTDCTVTPALSERRGLR
jgi:hypothetical protein